LANDFLEGLFIGDFFAFNVGSIVFLKLSYGKSIQFI
jgi:hypothetical protein